MRSPAFWWHEPGAAAWLLSPFGRIYAAACARRLRTPGARMDVPVICVGNLIAGGAGKTPVVRALATRLRAAGHAAHVVSRGHGGRLRGPVRVDPELHTAADVGDEPLLHAADGPAWIARDRLAGVRAAVASAAGIVILDDGFQNPQPAKDLSLIVVDGRTGFGNTHVIPAGPLREPIAHGLDRAQAVIVIGAPGKALLRDLSASPKPVLGARLVPNGDVQRWKGRRVLAFAGIGDPPKFFATLAEIGAELVASRSFPDHHPYSLRDIERLMDEARRLDARPVTTEKDRVRLPPSSRMAVESVDVRLEFDDTSMIDRLLLDLTSGPR